ncbi:MAG: class I SAM-dependent methyltransferase [Candidatus Thorarchaeota archaeon]
MVDLIREQWEANAQAFADLISNKGTPHHQRILNPCIEKLLGDVQGKSMLDAGCGEGYLSRFYAQKGAIVTGVDFSENLIEIAREKSKDTSVSFQVGNICDLEGFSESVFDVVLCNLVLLNVSCLSESMNEFNRILKHGGTLVFSIVHPAFNFYGPGSWEMGEKDPDTSRRKGLFFKVDDYMDEKEYERYWQKRDGERFPQPITFYHRTISTYVNALVNSSFQIEVMDEPVPNTSDDFFEREQRVPFFLVFKARKSDTIP